MVTIARVVHDGLSAIAITSRSTRLVIVDAIGPRIAAFGPVDGASMLFWDHEQAHARGDWRLYGGHRLWVTRPGADESEETYFPDNAPCKVRMLEDGVRVTAPPDRARIEKSIAVRVQGDTWRISHHLRNTSDMLWTGGAWALTCTRPTTRTRYRVPLAIEQPAWDVLVMALPRRWGGGHTSRLADPQFTFTEDALVLAPRGIEAKRMLSASRGTLEMRDPLRGTFVKTSKYVRGSTYPLATNVALYVAPRNFMVELETMSPVSTLAPGDVLDHVEHWTYTSVRRRSSVRSGS